MVLGVFGVVLVHAVLRAVAVFSVPAVVMVAMVMVAVFAMGVLVAVVPFAVVYVLGRVGLDFDRWLRCRRWRWCCHDGVTLPLQPERR